MIYICVSTQDHAPTVGLVLWKVRRVFTAFPREYHLLVADESTFEETSELLERYQRVLPMTVLRGSAPRPHGASLEALLREALARSDRPKRDAAVVLPPDFGVSPDAVPDLVRRLESGADVIVAESGRPSSVRGHILRRLAPWLLRPGVSLPGVRDLLSGCCACRLVTVKLAIRDHEGPLLASRGVCASAELVVRVAAHARRVATVPAPATSAIGPGPGALALAVELYRTGRRLRLAPQPARTAS